MKRKTSKKKKPSLMKKASSVLALATGVAVLFDKVLEIIQRLASLKN